MIKELLDKNLVDYIAMDIKSNLEAYEEAAKVKVDLENIKKSVELIKNSNIGYEFRTTVVPEMHDKENMKKIGEWLKGSKKFTIQNFRPGKCLNEFYNERTGFKKEELQDFKLILDDYFDKVEVKE